MRIYETVQGDPFDAIAKKLYGDEKLMEALFDANPAQMGVVVFPAGVRLNAPEASARERSLNEPPPWRKA